MSATFGSAVSLRGKHIEIYARRRTNSTILPPTADIIGSIQMQLAKFFSTSQNDVEVATTASSERRNRRSSFELSSSVTVKDDHDIAISQKGQRHSNLELFLSTGARSVVITRMAYTCGQGYQPANNASICRPCDLNHYKETLGNETCVPCPRGAVSQENTSFQAFSLDVCRCLPGSRPSNFLTNGSQPNASQPSLNLSSYWAGGLECVTRLEEATVEQVSGVLTDVVASIVAIQIASTVIRVLMCFLS